MQAESILSGTIRRLYVLDFGLFQVHEDGRIIGIPGYLIQTHDGRNILVDTGFPARYVDDAQAAAMAGGLDSFGQVLKLDEKNLPAGQLALIGLTTGDIQTLVLTHGDIDHVGGITDFPGATIVIGRQERELPRPRYFEDHSPIEWPAGVNYQLIDQNTVLCPGVALLTTPGHSPGHLSLLLRLPDAGTVLLIGDAIARPAEMEEGFGGAWDETVARSSAERLMAVAQREKAMIIYGHDPEQWPTLRKAPAYYS